MSRFRVANGTQADVAAAFVRRPRLVDNVPGFLGLETFTDEQDAAIFYLFTRWTDLDAFRRWHGSAAHRESHRRMPKGLKLDPSFTRVWHLNKLSD